MAARKIDFLRRVMCQEPDGTRVPTLSTHDEYVRDNLVTAAQALSFGLVRLSNGFEDITHDIKATQAGRLLADGRIEEAAWAIGPLGRKAKPIGHEPWGSVGARLRPGAPPAALDSTWSRTHACEILRGIACGHLLVEGDMVRRPADPAGEGGTSPRGHGMAAELAGLGRPGPWTGSARAARGR